MVWVPDRMVQCDVAAEGDAEDDRLLNTESLAERD
jgi:hypothetical protein